MVVSSFKSGPFDFYRFRKQTKIYVVIPSSYFLSKMTQKWYTVGNTTYEKYLTNKMAVLLENYSYINWD